MTQLNTQKLKLPIYGIYYLTNLDGYTDFKINFAELPNPLVKTRFLTEFSEMY